MKKESKKAYLIAMLWLIMGYICWITGFYSFSCFYFTSMKAVRINVLEDSEEI